MSEYNSLPPFQRDNADDLAGELYPDFFSGTSSPTMPTSINNLTGQQSIPPWSLSSTDSFAAQNSMAAPWSISSTSGPGMAEAEQPARATMPVQDVATTQSLIAALQSTMTTTNKAPVVIPGAKKSERNTNKIKKTVKKKAERHLHPQLRLGIILVVLFVVLLIALFSLSPLGGGQSSFPVLRSVIDWVQAQQQGLDTVIAHTIAGTQNNQAAPAAVNLPPMAIPRSQYVALARQDAIDAGINPDYFVRQINLESGFNPNAVSPSGAVGIAQFLPGTASGLGVNPYDPVSALRGAARYMANYVNQYGGDYAKALAAYNSGSGTVSYAVMVGGTNWRNYLPAETQNYIHIIMGI